MFIFILFSLSYSQQCNITNPQNTLQVVTFNQPYYIELLDYFQGIGYQFTITNANSIDNILFNPFNDVQATILPILTSNIISISTENEDQHQYIETNELSILGFDDSGNYTILNGEIQSDGKVTYTNITLPLTQDKFNCLKIKLIVKSIILLSCLNTSDMLVYYLLDIESDELASIITTQTITDLINTDLYVYYNNSELTMQQVFIQNGQSLLLTGIVNITTKSLQLVYDFQYPNQYINMMMGLDGTIFQLTTEYLIINGLKLKQLDSSNFTQFAIQQFDNNTHQYAILTTTTSYLQYFLYNSKFPTATISLIEGQIPKAYQLNYQIVNMFGSQIILQNKNGVLYYEIESSINLIGFYNLAYQYKAAIQWTNHLMLIFFDDSQRTVQFTYPKLYLLQEMISTSKSSISVESISVDKSTCSVDFLIKFVNQTTYPDVIATLNGTLEGQINEYPNYYFTILSKLFVGANISYSSNTGEQNATVSIHQPITYTRSSEKGEFVFQGVCNINIIRIFISQLTNYTLIILSERTDNLVIQDLDDIVQYFNCETLTNYITIQLQLSQSIEIIQLSLNNILLQNQEIQVNDLPNLPTNSILIQSELLYNILYIITQSDEEDHNYLFIINISNLQNVNYIQTITNKNPRKLFSNRQEYFNYLFVDNTDSLLIIQTLENKVYQKTILKYPINKVQYVGIGLLSQSIYLALYSSSGSNLYQINRYSLFTIQILQNILFTEIYLNGQIFVIPIISTFTSDQFYILFQQGNDQICIAFQQLKTPYNAIQYMSTQLQNSQFMSSNSKLNQDLIIINTNSTNQFYSITNYHPIIAQVLPSLNGQHEYQLQVNYTGKTLHKSQTISENYTVENIYLDIENIQSITYELDKGLNTIELQTAQLFFGIVQQYQVNCTTCQSIQSQNPIEIINTYNIGSILAAANSNQQDFQIIYLQNNISLYQISNDKYYKLYDFTNTLYDCNVLFVEILTQYPVSICAVQNQQYSIISVYNIDIGDTILQEIDIINIEKVFYQNGIIQFICNDQYIAAYFWISNNQIGYDQFYSNKYTFRNANPLNITMGNNLGSIPCQRFGILYSVTIEEKDFISSLINYFCTPEYILLIFNSSAIPQNNQNTTTIERYDLSNYLRFHKILSAQQYTYPQIQDNQLKIYVIFQTNVQPYIFLVSIDQDQFISFNQLCRYYQEQFNYELYINNQIIINLNKEYSGNILINVYADYIQNSNQCQYKLYQLPIIGYIVLQDQPTDLSTFLLTGYLIVSSQNTTLLTQIIPYLKIDVDITRSTLIGVTAINSYSTAVEYIFINSSFKWWVVLILVTVVMVISFGAFMLCRKYKDTILRNQEQIELRVLRNG